ncbi:protein TIC236, chloroplastic isoform X1 [Nicotiana tabacum]|uniref:Protein TIC236, chloroplastic isoform X1 n=1 Tax=Nicotiana tabacum TaxID=4097 RepID=A0AC58TXZ7_TOBAC
MEIMRAKLHSPFLGLPLQCNFNRRKSGNYISGVRSSRRGVYNCRCSKKGDWITQGVKFTHSCGRNVELLWKSFALRSGTLVCSVREPLVRSKGLVKSLVPVWEEGLFFVRCSIFGAVISGVCLLLWYGQLKAKSYIEAKLLPSVCALLSEYVQRELDFGRVRRISPLSITLESCSFGPHSEEFSCGELPTVKLRIRPFSSLSRGKIVVDAVLSNPSILVVQKQNYTWLGLPFSEGSPLSRLSDEEGIDLRTKIRRIAREEAATRWARERDVAAREAAEKGYLLPEGNSFLLDDDFSKNAATTLARIVTSESFFCMDEKLHWRDQHHMDAGGEYDLKHADLEKTFGAKVPPSGTRFWSKIIPDALRQRFKKANGRDLSAAGIAARRRILERSASAACLYFKGPSNANLGVCCPPSEAYDVANPAIFPVKSEGDTSPSVSSPTISEEVVNLVDNSEGNLFTSNAKRNVFDCGSSSEGISDKVETCQLDLMCQKMLGTYPLPVEKCGSDCIDGLAVLRDPFLFTLVRLCKALSLSEKLSCTNMGDKTADGPGESSEEIAADIMNRGANSRDDSHRFEEQVQQSHWGALDIRQGNASSGSGFTVLEPLPLQHPSKTLQSWSPKSALYSFVKSLGQLGANSIVKPMERLKFEMSPRVEDIVAELVDGDYGKHISSVEKMVPVILDSVHFSGGSLMLLAYGDTEPREMENVTGHIKFQNHYGRVHVQLNGNCKMWRSDIRSDNGGWLSTDVYVDMTEQIWHANLKIVNLFVPLFERILEIPITWSKGRASGEVHMCMDKGESFPNLHGQLDVTGLAFQIYDAPSGFWDMSASLCFRAQRIFLHNTSGWFGDVPLEASGDFGINPEEGEFHLMCQVPSVEVNALMKTFKMKPLLFPLAGSVTAVFNCQGPLDIPIFVGSALVSRKIANLANEFPKSAAYEAVISNKEAGAVAAIDRVPFSYISANFTFNTDNCVADLYGIRASLTDGGEIRGAGNAWICPEGEVDDTAMDVNFSGNLSFDKTMDRYLPGFLQLMPLKLGHLNGDTKISGSLLKPRFDIKWTAPKAEGSLTDARGDIIISPDHITVNSSSVAFDLYSKVLTSYRDDYCLNLRDYHVNAPLPFTVEGVELDLRMRSFEFFSSVSSYALDSPKPVHLKATGRIKFQGKVVKASSIADQHFVHSEKRSEDVPVECNDATDTLSGEVSISGLKLNQLMLAPQMAGALSITQQGLKLDAMGRPDESLNLEVRGPFHPLSEENMIGKMFSFSFQKGQLKANMCYLPLHSANLEVRHLPLDELELASLRGTIQRAEIQLNFQKRRGHGELSVLRPKFSGLLGEALDVAARWSGDVITIEKSILEQSNSKYELQGEYVLPGTRDRMPSGQERGNLFHRAMTGHLGSVISSMGRWRMRLEVPRAEIAEMLPLARLLSRSSDPAVQSRSKDLFIQSLHSIGLYTESLQKLLEEIRGHSTLSDEVILEEFNLPGLAELKGHWSGSLDASGGGNGDTMAEFDFHGEEWEWGAYKTQRVLAAGAYSNDDGLRLERIFIQKDNATIHADGTLFGAKTNLHFAVLNFPVSLVPTVVQVIESTATEAVHSLRQFLSPIRGILHMEGDLRGNLAKPECDVQVRLLDGAIGGIELGRAEIVASLTPTSRFLFNAKFEPIIQNGHVHVQGSVPVTFVQNNVLEEDNSERDKSEALWVRSWGAEKSKAPVDEASDKRSSRERNEEGWDTQLAENLKGLNWNLLDAGEVRIDADIKDSGMMLLTALSPYANWLHGNAEVVLQVRGTVEQPVLDGSASFHRATVSSPVFRKPLTNFGGSVLVNSNRLSISSLEGRVSRKGKLSVKGNLPLRTVEASDGDKIDLKCEVLEVRAKNILSGQVDTQLQISGSILQPNISGKMKLSHGEAYLPHDKGSGTAPFNRETSDQSRLPAGGYNRIVASKYVSRFLSLKPAASSIQFNQSSGKDAEDIKESVQVESKPKLDIRLSDLKLVLGPELRIVYPLILNFAVSGELELNGVAHPKWIKPKGILMFENGDVNLVATQVRLKRDHLNIAKFEPDNGLDPTLDLALVGSEWQFRIQSRASKWQDNLVVTSTRSVEQDVLSPTEAARVFESQLAESILEGDGQLAFKKLAAATLETLMPRIEGKGEFGQARWRLVYAPQIPNLLSVDPSVDPLKSLASNISFGTEVEVQLGKRLQASVVRQMKDSEMAMQWTLIYQLTSRLRVLLQSTPSKRLLFEYSTTSQD